MKYKTELHCHTEIGSPCSDESEKNTVEKYIKYGYDTIVITNHFSYSGRDDSTSYDDLVDIIGRAVDAAKEAADGRINILEGIELRTKLDPNDYLVYGITREFLKSFRDMLTTPTSELHKIFRDNGMIMIQAHPFRFGQKLMSPENVDGYEIFNGHLEQYSHNDLAKIWGERFKGFGMIYTSGSDKHDEIHFPTAGITTDTEIKTNEQLIDTLKKGCYELITCDLEKLTFIKDKSLF